MLTIAFNFFNDKLGEHFGTLLKLCPIILSSLWVASRELALSFDFSPMKSAFSLKQSIVENNYYNEPHEY